MESFKILHYEYVLKTCFSYFSDSPQYKRLARILNTALYLIKGLENKSENRRDKEFNAMIYAREKLFDLFDKEYTSDYRDEDDLIDNDFVHDVRSFFFKKEYRPHLNINSDAYLSGFRASMVEGKKPNNRVFVSKYLEYIINLINTYTVKEWIPIQKELRKEADDVFNDRLTNIIPITFLSYAFTDNVFAYYLYKLFKNNGGFIYVDSLMGDQHNNGEDIKKSIYPWINKSYQFLFLRSIKSDNTQIRQWCSWEFGNAYKIIDNDKFFYVQIGDKPFPKNLILDGFQRMVGVNDGLIF